MARYGIVIINFNGEKFLRKQIRSIKKYMLFSGSLDIIVVDNSREKNRLSEICNDEKVIYKKYYFDEGDFSTHHALALNAVYDEYKNNFNALLFLDHDVFLFDQSDILIRGLSKSFMGVGQEKAGKKYLHPGVFFMNLDRLKGKEIDFLPCVGMDTGGRMSKLIMGLKKEVVYLGMSYTKFWDNDFYEVVDNTFMHFVKGSNWNKNKEHNNRMKYLFNELKDISK